MSSVQKAHAAKVDFDREVGWWISEPPSCDYARCHLVGEARSKHHRVKRGETEESNSLGARKRQSESMVDVLAELGLK